MNTNMLARFYELRYFGSLFHFYFKFIERCLGNHGSLFIHVTVVRIEEGKARDISRLNRTLKIVK